MSLEEKPKGYKVLKGPILEKAVLDSTWPDIKRANKRKEVLKKSTRKSKWTRGPKVNIWVLPMTEDDPFNYRRSKKGPWEGYDRSGPQVIKD